MKYLILLALFAVTLPAPAELPLNNREPNFNEIGYHPAEDSTAAFNPPSFTWLHEKPASRYILQWADNAEFKNAVTVSNLMFNVHTHHSTLPPGSYFWRYRFVTEKQELSQWSKVRRFKIEPGAIEFPMPSKEQRRKWIPQKHPRIFVRPEELPALREAATNSASKRFKPLRDAADRMLERAPIPEPTVLGTTRDKSNLEAIAAWWPNRTTTVQACAEAETLAFVYMITGEKRYGDAARGRIVALAKWDPDGPTNFKLNCEAGKPLLHRLSRAYDWAYDALTDDDRELVRKVVARRIHDAWVSGEVGRGVGHLNQPLNSHGNRTWHKIGESGIVFLGEIPEAETWLDYALNKYFAAYPVWSDADGGWHEGAAYLGGYMSKAVWWLHVAEKALKLDPLKKPFFSQVGDFPLYVAPPKSPNIGMGDLAYVNNVGGWGSFMEYFIRVAAANPGSNAPQWRWWGEQWNTTEAGGILGFLYLATLPELPPSQPPGSLPVSKVFHGIGQASLHTTLLNTDDDVHFLFKSSPFGSRSHGHNPQNSFQLNAYGEVLLPANNYRDLHGSDFHYKWVHETVSQNAVLVNGKGQLPHHALSRGKIVYSELTPEWDCVVGDAVEAYEGRLARALRHVYFIKPDLIILCDDLVASEPSTFQFMLHGLSPFDLNEASSELHIQQPKAGATIRYTGSLPVKLCQWDGYPYPIIRNQFPNQWHVEAATTEKQKAVRMFTVIAPHKGTKRPSLDIQTRTTNDADLIEVTINSRKASVWVPKEPTFDSHARVEVRQLSGVK